MSVLLTCENLEKSFGPRLLFRGISLGLSDEEHTGLIGPNGSGKSTLLKILAGLETPDDGTLVLRRGLRLGYVAQEDTFDGDATVEQLLARAIDDDHVDEHDRHTRAGMMAGRLGFEDLNQGAAALSGGWRKRLAIGRQLIREPDLLLLDEPTNHLDLEGVLWLEKLLTGARFACLIVSHDRAFLENVTGRTIELSRAYPQGFLSIDGPYSEFLVKREEFLAAQASRQQALASTVRREIEWLSRKAKARTTKAKGRIQSADRMMAELAELKTVAKSLGGRPLFRDVNLVLAPGTRLARSSHTASCTTTYSQSLGPCGLQWIALPSCPPPESLPARGTSPIPLYVGTENSERSPRVRRWWSRNLTRHRFITPSIMATWTCWPLPDFSAGLKAASRPIAGCNPVPLSPICAPVTEGGPSGTPMVLMAPPIACATFS